MRIDRVFKAIHTFKEATSEKEQRAFEQKCSVEQKVQNGVDYIAYKIKEALRK